MPLHWECVHSSGRVSCRTQFDLEVERQHVSDTVLGICGEVEGRRGDMWLTYFHFGKHILYTLNVLYPQLHGA